MNRLEKSFQKKKKNVIRKALLVEKCDLFIFFPSPAPHSKGRVALISSLNFAPCHFGSVCK